MSKLEVRSPDGRSELRKLSRSSPIIVGRNPISDIAVADDAVAPIHCRVSWNGKGFEVAAVAPDGVDVNGVLVRRKELTDGDVIRVGTFDLVLVNGSGERVKATEGAKAKPRREELQPHPVAISDADLEILSQGEVEIPIVAATPRPKPAAEVRHETASAAEPPGKEPGLEDELPVLPVEPAPKFDDKRATKRSDGGPRPAGLWSRLRGRRRPGEQEAVRSPLVLGLGGLTLTLLLAAGTIWLLIGREGADRRYATATGHREAGRFADAIASYEQFLTEYAGDSRADEARYELGRTRVERYTAGGAPDWKKAIEEFDGFARAHREEADFDERRDVFLKLAEGIASGAAAAATRGGDRESLAAAAEGTKRFDRYAPADGAAGAVRDRIAKEYARAEAAVRKREYFDDAVVRMEAALAKPDLDAAFTTRGNLLARYPDLASSKRVQALLERTLEAERKLVKGEVPDDRRGAAGEEARSLGTVTVVGHTQARAGEVSGGRLVCAAARDSAFGIDATTGRPKWRRAIGLDTPFAPIEVDASVPALLAFDASRNELVLIRREDGELLWRTPVGAAVGRPLVAQGQIDLATSDGRLLRFALETGEPLAGVSFPQGIVGPPVLADGGERLVLFGERATAYTLDLRSLEVRAVSFVGQAAGSIEAPPAGLGGLVVVCENDRLDSSRVRALTVDASTGSLREVASERIDGRTREPLVARGNVLLVPSSQERITAFSVSDQAGQPPLMRLAGVQIPEAKDVPTFLVAGPEGLVWAAGSALRKLRLGPDGLEILQGAVAPGRHTQGPQESGDSLFVARSLSSSPAVYVSQADREAMTGTWRTVIGGSVLAVAVEGSAATVVTDAGQAAVLRPGASGGFVDSRPLPRWDEAAADPLKAAGLADGRAVAWRGGGNPLLWLVRPGEEPGQPQTLAAAPECPLIALPGGIVVPIPGRIDWLPDSGGRPIDPFLLPVGGEGEARPTWRSLARIDDEHFAAADDAGLLRVIAVRQEPLPHLAEVASVSLGGPARPILSLGGRVVVATERQVRLLDPAGLRPVAEVTPDEPVTGGPWVAGETVFVQTGVGTLRGLDGADLAERWRVSLDGPVAGGPVATDDEWVAASQTGAVVRLTSEGAERSRIRLGETLTGLYRVGDGVLAASIGGSLHPVPRVESEEDSTSVTEASTAQGDAP